MEAAAMGFPALAVSLETHQSYHLSYSRDIDFIAAGQFTARFARLLLEGGLPEQVQVLKVEVPSDATPETAWELCRLTRQRYYDPTKPERASWDVPGTIGYREAWNSENEAPDTDAYVMRKKRLVAVTPIGLDLTARVDMSALDQQLRK